MIYPFVCIFVMIAFFLILAQFRQLFFLFQKKPREKHVEIFKTITDFINSHSNLVKEIEELTIQEAIELIKTLYHDEIVLVRIMKKISYEVEKLQKLEKQ